MRKRPKNSDGMKRITQNKANKLIVSFSVVHSPIVLFSNTANTKLQQKKLAFHLKIESLLKGKTAF